MDTLKKMLQKMEDENALFEYFKDNVKYNLLQKKIINNNEVIELTKSEILILDLLLKNKNMLASHTCKKLLRRGRV